MTEAEQGTLIVAIVGIGATSVVALAGLLVQVVLAGAAIRRGRRKDRYAELLAIYAETGRSMSATTYTYNQLLEMGTDGKVKAANAKAINERIEADARAFESRHSLMMLRLHDAHPAVIRALSDWQGVMQQGSHGTETELFQWWQAQCLALEADLRRYYEIAGIHARSELRSFIFRRWAQKPLEA